MRNAKDSARLISSGVSGLDAVLLGGFIRHSVVLVEGESGTGKSVLGWQYLHHGATVEQEPGLLISFELSPSKLLANARQFGWDFEKLQAQEKLHTIFTTPAVLGEEIQSPDSILAEEIARVGAKRIFIDGLAPLRGPSERYSGRPFRESLYNLLESLHRFNMTIMLTQETISPRGLECLEERFMCDTIVHLERELTDHHQNRTLQIIKSRGQPCIDGRHTLRIDSGRGLTVYRQAFTGSTPPPVNTDAFLPRPAIPTGICGLDDRMGGGLIGGSQCLVVGPRGTGKSALALHFLRANAHLGTHCVWLSCHSPAAEVHLLNQSLGLDRFLKDDQVVAATDSTESTIDLDVHFYALRQHLERHPHSCVVLDAVERYIQLRGTKGKEFLWAVESTLRRVGATGVYTHNGDSSYEGWQSLSASVPLIQADYVALLGLQHTTSWLRTLTWPKVRGGPPLAPLPIVLDTKTLRVSQSQAEDPGLSFSSYRTHQLSQVSQVSQVTAVSHVSGNLPSQNVKPSPLSDDERLAKQPAGLSPSSVPHSSP